MTIESHEHTTIEFSVKLGKGLWFYVITLLFVHASLLGITATQMSPTALEGPLLAAGVSHWQLGRYELYRVNPPLVRMVAAIPVVSAGCETDWSKFVDGTRVRPEYAIGYQFIELNGERSIWLMTLARWAVIPFSLIGGLYCFLWGRALCGRSIAGIIPLIIWCFDPLILGNASLITNDVAATSLGIVAGYYFWRWLLVPRWWSSFWLGVTLALAVLAKTTWLVLYGLWPFMTLLWLICRKQCEERSKKAWLFRGSQLILAIIVSLLGINMFYGFDGSFDRVHSYSFVSHKFQKLNDFLPVFSSAPILLPRQFVVGLDTQISDFEQTNQISYLRGQWRKVGWWHYYVYGLWVKWPHGTQLLFILTICMWLVRQWRPTADEFILLLPGCTVLFIVSSQTAFNHHFRYILPFVGFACIFMGKIALLADRKQWTTIVVIMLLTFSTMSSLLTTPHYLSYYNELAGGPRKGYCHMLHSASDWGQDLLYLKKWLKEHPEVQLTGLGYMGGFPPSALGLDVKSPPEIPEIYKTLLSTTMQYNKSIDLQPGWYAISVNYLYSQEGTYRYFLDYSPVAMAGYSIYIYHLTQSDIAKMQQHRNDTIDKNSDFQDASNMQSEGKP